MHNVTVVDIAYIDVAHGTVCRLQAPKTCVGVHEQNLIEHFTF